MSTTQQPPSGFRRVANAGGNANATHHAGLVQQAVSHRWSARTLAWLAEHDLDALPDEWRAEARRIAEGGR